jgi:hypothetical protein
VGQAIILKQYYKSEPRATYYARAVITAFLKINNTLRRNILCPRQKAEHIKNHII